MSQRIATLKQNLTQARSTLNQALDRAQDHADEQIYSEGAQWTLRQLAIHLALADIGHNQMVWQYAQDKEFIPADYDINRYNKRSVEKQDEMTYAQARASLAQSREAFIAWLDALDDDSVLDKTGRHATLRILSLEQIIGIMYQHEIAHANDIMGMVDGA
ncbi:MAG: DinB family protein [Anaerolineae bacterium]